MEQYINDYECYILNETNMKNYLKYKIENKIQEKKELIHKDEITFKKNDVKLNIPKEQDSLFWCYYIIKNGDLAYEILNNKNSLLTRQKKIDYIKIIRENKQVIKTYKFDTITNIENNLANDININIKTIMTLCAIEGINLIFVSKKTYYELLVNDLTDIYIIREIPVNNKYQNSNKKYGFELGNNENINEIKNNLYKIETIDKPIKALSSYKSKELTDIAEKLAIEIINKETGKNKTKNELYESIIQYF